MTKRAQSTLLFVVLVAIVVYELAVLAIIGVESDSSNANIRTASDALWWGYVTVSTVGYGDHYPVTITGRVIGILLMTVGVALFTGITSFMADWFRRPRQSSQPDVSKILGGSGDTLTLLATMRGALEEQSQTHQDAIDRLQEQLNEIERHVRQGLP